MIRTGLYHPTNFIVCYFFSCYISVYTCMFEFWRQKLVYVSKYYPPLNVSKVTKTGRHPLTSGPVWIRVALVTGTSRLILRLSRKMSTILLRKLSLVSGCLVVTPCNIILFFLFCSNSYIFSCQIERIKYWFLTILLTLR